MYNYNIYKGEYFIFCYLLRLESNLLMRSFLPNDTTSFDIIAVLSIFICWIGYSALLRLIAGGSLNDQLSVVRARWMNNATTRIVKPFDGILLGHIINSVAFFGSATMIVLAGVITSFMNSRPRLQLPHFCG